MIDTPLFDGVGATAYTPPVTREADIKRAFERADAVFLNNYERTLRTVASDVPDFIAGDVTERYERIFGPLAYHQKKALGGVYQRAMRAGLIVKTGEYRARNQGNAAAVYRGKR